MNSFFAFKISFPYFISILFLSILSTYFVTDFLGSKKIKESENEILAANSCDPSLKRLNGYDYVKPLLFVDNNCNAAYLNSVIEGVNTVIEKSKKEEDLTSASVYLKDFSTNEIVSINENEKYKPGSLMKVPELITLLLMNEKNPGFLDKKLVYDRVVNSDKKPEYLSKSIQLGHSYTVRELMTYMIEYSDNNATILLNSVLDVTLFKKVFTDLGLESPDWNSPNYFVTVTDYSKFIRTLYNASYLTINDSEYATKLLSKCNFKDGILKGLPENTKVAHKFGEAGDAKEKQLTETAIIYLKDKPYMITIMTKGKDFAKLAEVIKQISFVTYQNMLSI